MHLEAALKFGPAFIYNVGGSDRPFIAFYKA